MEEAAFCGVVVAGVMLGVPLYHNIREFRQGRMVTVHLFRWWLVCAIMIFLGLFLAMLFGCSILLLASLPPPKLVPESESTSCKILSKGVDIRSARVCQVDHFLRMPSSGFDNKRHSKFQCYFDYYWTSVFKVEYRPHSAEAAVEAAAEAPGEALPLGCRPNFGTVWRAKEMIQINQDYPCKYDPGNLLFVELTDRILGNCTRNDHLKSGVYFNQFWTLLAHHMKSFISSPRTGPVFWRTAILVSLGFCYSIFVTVVTKLASEIRFRFVVSEGYSDMDVLYFEAQTQATFLFVACMFSLVWLSAGREEQIDRVMQQFLASMQKALS